MRITIVGGDARMPYTAAALMGMGHQTALCAYRDTPFSPSMLSVAEAVLLPLPLSRDGVHLNAPTTEIATPLSEMARMLPEGVPLLCGHADDTLRAIAGDRPILAYGQDEEYLRKNAYITAEGAIAMLMAELSSALADTPCLILGAGRLASALSDLLFGLHAPTTVLARRQNILLGGGLTPLPLDELPELCDKFSVILNTVPAKLLSRAVLERITPGTLILELSSAPRVVDAEEAGRRGIELLAAPGLPGRYAPKSAGQAIADTVAALLAGL